MSALRFPSEPASARDGLFAALRRSPTDTLKRDRPQRQTRRLRGEKPTRTAAGLFREGLLAVVEGDEASRAVQIALVSRLDDAELLIDIALSAVRIPARRDALQRLDAVQQDAPLATAQLERLVPCLREGALLPWAVVLMDAAGFDWCARSDAAVADALCAASYSCVGIHEEVLVEDAFAQLAHYRPDLAGCLRACRPEQFLPSALQPFPVRAITLIGRARCDNVA
ncbi:MAG TPA: hypothetical protein IAC12_09220 [Candidatus Aphodovivens avistercoris]|nr:hypothetical protein [Candidatus Aphodovivens avistercoris]